MNVEAQNFLEALRWPNKTRISNKLVGLFHQRIPFTPFPWSSTVLCDDALCTYVRLYGHHKMPLGRNSWHEALILAYIYMSEKYVCMLIVIHIVNILDLNF